MDIINRVESKYILDNLTYKKLLKEITNYIEKDQYFSSTICNIYFDTTRNDLIIKSIEKPIFKEKVRLRSYNVPTLDDFVYLEIKNKYKKFSNKRRIKIKLGDYNKKNYENTQIMKEINYLFKYYNLKPAIFIAYDRNSYILKENNQFRITFDFNLRSRRKDLNLEFGDYGTKYFNDDKVIMEIKSLNSMPLWFTKIMSQLKIYPTSFSKYGSIYQKEKLEEVIL